MTYIPADGTIRVAAVREKRDTPWYRVSAFSPSGDPIGQGWVNSSALLGQDISIVRTDTSPKDGPKANTLRGAPPKPHPPDVAKAKRKLSLAKAYRKAGMGDKAKVLLREIIAKYPESQHASEANEVLEKLE